MLHQISIIVEVSELTRQTTPRKRVDPPGKMGRPRTAEELRISRGVRLDPELITRADAFVEQLAELRRQQKGRAAPVPDPHPTVRNFTSLVERSLAEWLGRHESGLKRKS